LLLIPLFAVALLSTPALAEAPAGAVLAQQVLPELSARAQSAEARIAAGEAYFEGNAALAEAWPDLDGAPLNGTGFLEGAQYRFDLISRQDRHHCRQRLQNLTGHTLGVFNLGLGHLLLYVVCSVSHFDRIRRSQPGAVHQCRCSAYTGTGWGVGIGHGSPQHPYTLDDAGVQLVVDGPAALGLAEVDLIGKGRVLPPPPHGLPTHAYLGCDVGDRMRGQNQLQGALLPRLHGVSSGPF
jgi:hypothetical protein